MGFGEGNIFKLRVRDSWFGVVKEVWVILLILKW